jgi:hypothetical protein
MESGIKLSNSEYLTVKFRLISLQNLPPAPACHNWRIGTGIDFL